MSVAYFIWFSDKLKFYRLKMTLTSLVLTLRNTGYMLRIGSATFLTEVAMSVTIVAGNYMFMSMLHEDGVAAFAGLLCGVCVLLLLVVGDHLIVSAFLKSSEPSYDLAIHGLPWFATCSLFFALNVVFIGYYQSITMAKRAMAFTFLRGIVFSVLGFMVLPRLLGVIGLWTAIPAAELLTLVIILLKVKKVKG